MSNPSYTHPDAGVVIDQTTTTQARFEVERQSEALLLTLMWHPELHRVGEQHVLAHPGGHQRVNRFEPAFARLTVAGPAATAQPQPLLHTGVSRAALLLATNIDGSVTLSREDERVRAEVNGRPLTHTMRLTLNQLTAGVVIQLGSRVVLCLHRAQLLPVTPEPGLLGISSAMERLRRQLHLVAPTAMPVLILGESGTGKELVAQALHRLSPRRAAPFVAVNMATLNEGLAAAELFGAARGAYTGAQTARSGLWASAEGGTLFLDEVGDTPALVQPMLLRVIETGELRAVGANRSSPCDVRLVAATDRVLDAERFNQPLLRRLQTFVLHTPTLRERREDLGLLARHWLAAESPVLDWAADMPSALVRALCLHDWPGNVRQLAQAMRRLALTGPIGLWPSVSELLGEPLRMPAADGSRSSPIAAGLVAEPEAAWHAQPDSQHQPASSPAAWPEAVHPAPKQPAADAQAVAPSRAEAAPARRAWRSTAGISADTLFAALDEHGWQLQDAARSLGVSRPSLYNLLARQPGLRPADHWQADELAQKLSQPGLTMAALARQLRCPREALRRRLRSLGLPRPPDDDEAGQPSP